MPIDERAHSEPRRSRPWRRIGDPPTLRIVEPWLLVFVELDSIAVRVIGDLVHLVGLHWVSKPRLGIRRCDEAGDPCAGIALATINEPPAAISKTWYGPPVSIKGLIVVLLLAGGCVRVHAHQRGTLARHDMELGSTPDMASGEDHARAYREGAMGGGSGKAGGCGCN